MKKYNYTAYWLEMYSIQKEYNFWNLIQYNAFLYCLNIYPTGYCLHSGATLGATLQVFNYCTVPPYITRGYGGAPPDMWAMLGYSKIQNVYAVCWIRNRRPRPPVRGSHLEKEFPTCPRISGWLSSEWANIAGARASDSQSPVGRFCHWSFPRSFQDYLTLHKCGYIPPPGTKAKGVHECIVCKHTEVYDCK